MGKAPIKPRKEIKVERHSGISMLLKWDEKQNKYTEPQNSKKFRALKCIKGKKDSRMFYTLREAMDWRNAYSTKDMRDNHKPKSPLISEVWNRYKEAVFPSLEKSSVETKLYRSSFIQSLFAYRISDITPSHIDNIIRNAKGKTIKDGYKKRYNFDKELEELRVLFNWYKENDDYKCVNPILKRHYAMGKIKDIPVREKKMSPEEFVTFLKSLKQNCDALFYDLAITQFYTASRIQEMAGLQKGCVDFTQEQLTIRDVVVWDRHRKFGYLKERPKNGEVRYCSINETMKQSLLRQYNSSKCNYVFQKNGQPLMYRDVQYNYNKALKKSGLFPK
ncbi:MAG: tyrosine-type recombinase/integrase, partial [bacterium]